MTVIAMTRAMSSQGKCVRSPLALRAHPLGSGLVMLDARYDCASASLMSVFRRSVRPRRSTFPIGVPRRNAMKT